MGKKRRSLYSLRKPKFWDNTQNSLNFVWETSVHNNTLSKRSTLKISIRFFPFNDFYDGWLHLQITLSKNQKKKSFHKIKKKNHNFLFPIPKKKLQF